MRLGHQRGVLAAGLGLALGMLTATQATAATITGSIGAIHPFTVYDLATGTDDWSAYGGLGASGTPTTDYTYNAAGGSIGAIAVTDGTGYTATLWGPIKFAYGPAAGTYATPTGVSWVDVNPVVADKGAGGSQLTFTHTLLAGSEQLKIFVLTKSYDDAKVDVLAKIGSDTFSQTMALPESLDSNDNSMGDFGKGRFGIVTLDISNAAALQPLEFTLTGNYAGESPISWWGVGIAGVSVTAVPEPATLGLLALSSVMLCVRRRAKA